ncbi:hypothetical protein ASG85_35780 [Paenibacillus sp. Soil724D2]|nr:hypothetical protein ASG85_35780 [Paenibacillus sp. Soil724D2]
MVTTFGMLKKSGISRSIRIILNNQCIVLPVNSHDELRLLVFVFSFSVKGGSIYKLLNLI